MNKLNAPTNKHATTDTRDTAGEPAPATLTPRDERISQITGFLMSVIWLGFLVFPVLDVLASTRPTTEKALLVGLLVAYAVVYTLGMFYAITRPMPFSDTFHPTSGLLAAIAAVLFVVFTLAWPGAVTIGIFLMALVVITLPPRISYPLGAVIAAAVIGITAWQHSGRLWGITVITLAVYMTTVGSSYFTRLSEREARSARREAILDERERVARDVHDVLGHTLTVISLKSELAAKLIDRDPARSRAEILEINQLSRQAISDVRATVSGLTNRSLATELATIRTLTSDVGLNLTITGSADDADPRHRILFGWVAREAMTNVVRHAKASAVRIEIGESWLSVIDDGVGLGSAAEGNGLRGLRHRVEDVGGKLTISPGPAGQGTKVEVRM